MIPPARGTRPQRSIILYASNRCNLRCAFCLEDGRRPDTMLPLDELRRELAGVDPAEVRNVMFMGSETVLRADVLDVIELLRDMGFSGIGVATNGTALTRPERLLRLMDAGLSHMELSIHSLRPETAEEISGRGFTLGKQLECLAVIDEVVAERPLSVTINAVACSLNLGDIAPLVHTIERDFPRIAPRYQIKGTLPTEAALRSGVLPRWSDVRASGLVADLPRVVHPRLSFTDFPLCVLHPHEHLSGNLGSLAVAEDYTYLEGETWSASDALTSRARAYGAPCERCAAKEVCCGMAPEYLALEGDAVWSPIEEPATDLLARVLAWRRAQGLVVDDAVVGDIDGVVAAQAALIAEQPADPTEPFVAAYLGGNRRARTKLFTVTDVCLREGGGRVDLTLHEGDDELTVFVEPLVPERLPFARTRYLGLSYYAAPTAFDARRLRRLLTALSRALAHAEAALTAERVRRLFAQPAAGRRHGPSSATLPSRAPRLSSYAAPRVPSSVGAEAPGAQRRARSSPSAQPAPKRLPLVTPRSATPPVAAEE